MLARQAHAAIFLQKTRDTGATSQVWEHKKIKKICPGSKPGPCSRRCSSIQGVNAMTANQPTTIWPEDERDRKRSPARV
jgi:hypothetical protein